MSNVIPVPGKWIYYLKAQEETGPGHRVLAVKLNDGLVDSGRYTSRPIS